MSTFTKELMEVDTGNDYYGEEEEEEESKEPVSMKGQDTRQYFEQMMIDTTNKD